MHLLLPQGRPRQHRPAVSGRQQPHTFSIAWRCELFHVRGSLRRLVTLSPLSPCQSDPYLEQGVGFYHNGG